MMLAKKLSSWQQPTTTARSLAAAALVAALVCCISIAPTTAKSSEFTFDMSPHEVLCFYEVVAGGQELQMDYQVVYGGRLDIDAEVRLDGASIWEKTRSSGSRFLFKTEKESGEYAFCFSNKFSTVSHKSVYMSLATGMDDDDLAEENDPHQGALTQIESSIANIHNSLKRITSYQAYLRNRESYHRQTGEFMNSRVQLMSGLEALVLVLISVVQLYYIRSLFTEKPNRF